MQRHWEERERKRTEGRGVNRNGVRWTCFLWSSRSWKELRWSRRSLVAVEMKAAGVVEVEAAAVYGTNNANTILPAGR